MTVFDESKFERSFIEFMTNEVKKRNLNWATSKITLWDKSLYVFNTIYFIFL